MNIKKYVTCAMMLFIAALVSLEAGAADYYRSTFTQSLQSYTPSSGNTVTITRAYDAVVNINPASDLSSLTIALPVNVRDGDRVTLWSSRNIAALTFSGGTVSVPVTSMSAGSSLTMIYSTLNAAWFQTGGIGGSGGMDKIAGGSGTTTGAVVRKATGFYGLATSACDLFNGGAACAAAFGYADPRWFGASCSASFNQSGPDDGPYIQAAIDTGYDVLIPRPGCRIATRVVMKNDRQAVFGMGVGGGYNHNYMGYGAYIFVPNDIALNRESTLNCVFDSNGYDNVTLRNISVRGNYGLAGTVAVCNSVGVRSGRAAAFWNLEHVMFGNIGNGIGASITSIYDYRGTSTDSVLHGTGTKSFTVETGRFWTTGQEIVATATGITPTTTMTGTVTSYDSATGALVLDVTSVAGTAGTYASWSFNSSNPCIPVKTGVRAGLHNNVFQLRGAGIDMIGTCFGQYGNFTDFHTSDVYGAAIAHNSMAGLPGYGLTGSSDLTRYEFSGFGEGPTGAKTYFNKGAQVYYSTTAYLNLSNATFDRNEGASVWAQGEASPGRRAKNINLSNVVSIGAHRNGLVGTHSAHFVFDDVDGVSASNVTTYRNGYGTDYVVQFGGGSNTSVNWNGTGGASGSGAAIGGWDIAYFNLLTPPSNFTYNVPGVGAQFGDMKGYSEAEYNIGNSGASFTINLANGIFQKVTMTSNATATMPTPAVGKYFTLRALTGAGGLTLAFNGATKWPAGATPTLTPAASKMDLFSFVSDGTNWYGTAVQNYTP